MSSSSGISNGFTAGGAGRHVCGETTKYSPEHQIDGTNFIVRDPDAQYRTPSAEANEHARWLWDRSPLGYLIVDRSGNIVAMNASGRAMLGNLPSVDSPQLLVERMTGEQYTEFLDLLRSANEVSAGTAIELEFHNDTSIVRVVRMHILSVCASTIAMSVLDITDTRQLHRQSSELKDQLRHLQRLELINDISAGVAHDFNNLLQVIGGFASALKISEDMSERALEATQEILWATERASMLTRKLLEFSCKAGLTLESVDLGDLVQHCMKIVSSSLPRSIMWSVDVPESHNVCRVDARLIEQTLINLLLNARDAMPAGGALSVSIDRCAIEPNSMRSESIAAGKYVRISVSDTGVGIPDKLRDHIFEPFFTTKAEGAGTGLGLALVQGIVADHGGAIEVESQVGMGSTFRIYLPDNHFLPDSH